MHTLGIMQTVVPAFLGVESITAGHFLDDAIDSSLSSTKYKSSTESVKVIPQR
jgi:hypothetical protein